MTKDELLASADQLKADALAFAKKTVNEAYDERIHDAHDALGNVIKNANPFKTLVQGEESKVGHIASAIDNVIKPLLAELEGEPEPAPVA